MGAALVPPFLPLYSGSDMDTRDFLEYITAKQGYYCIVGLKRGHPIQKLFSDIDEALAQYDYLLSQGGIDIYFTCAKFRDNSNRRADNAKYFKSFWLDIDCGVTKKYLDKAQGLDALYSFYTSLNLPRPTVVDSGNGLHCYWALSEEISYNDWKPVAEHFKTMCTAKDFHADPSVTSDAARFLRLPNSYNYKSPDNRKEVKVLEIGDSLTLTQFKTAIEYEDQRGVYSFSEDKDDITASLARGVTANFSRIMKKSVKGLGCAHLLYAYQHQNSLSEPMWRSVMSVAQYCEDRNKAIHLMSRQYDGYDPAETEEKANNCKVGAHTCKEFQKHFGAERCESCLHKGIINSPIKLGVYVPEATPEDNIVKAKHKGLGEEVTFIIPAYPHPYFRGVEGGVYMKKMSPLAKGDDAPKEETDVLIYENDLYVEKRLKDDEYGEMALIKLHLPRDGVEEFTAPLQDILSRDKARSILASKGVAAMDNKMTAIMGYLSHYVNHLQKTETADIARAQFGWHDNDECFLVGTRLITADGVSYSSPSSATKERAARYTHSGHLSEWVKIADLYGKPGNEARAFAFGMGFGAPLVKFSGIKGFILHLTNEKSGVGKSTIQFMINSIWGHPEAGMMSFDDKFLARQHMMGVLKNLPMCIDEITDLTPEEIGTIAYMVTQGKGRDRMQAHHNALRKNNVTWELPCITSGNNSLYDALMSYKALPEGEMMRILEIYISPDKTLTKDESDTIYTENLYYNYGLAAEVLIKYMLNNKEECIKLFRDVRKDFDARANFSQKHRFYSAACAVSIAGLEIGKRCGLHNIDIKRVMSWAIANVGKAADAVSDENKSRNFALGEFLNEYNGNIFIGYKELLNNLPQSPEWVPRNEVVARYDIDSHTIAISASVLRKWCTKKQIPYKGFLARLAKEGYYTGTTPYRLIYGVGVVGSKVNSAHFILENAHEFIPDLDIAPETRG